MIGFIVGIGSLIGLVKVLGHRRCHGRHHRGGCGAGARHGRWQRGPLWAILDRLDTTPGQEKVIREEVEGIIDQLHDVKRSWWRGGDDLAQVLSNEAVDEAAIDEVLARNGARLDELRKQTARALARIHETLDPQQRRRLARILSAGPWRGGLFHGPYRS
jgi:Spy/CpxP family protein refolding chaperone